MAYLEGASAERLFESAWAKLLDSPLDKIHELAVTASRRGWLNYRNAGGIIDVDFPVFFAEQEKELLK